MGGGGAFFESGGRGRFAPEGPNCLHFCSPRSYLVTLCYWWNPFISAGLQVLSDILPSLFGIDLRHGVYFLPCAGLQAWTPEGHIGSHVNALTHYVTEGPGLQGLKDAALTFLKWAPDMEERHRKAAGSTAPIVIACWCYDGLYHSVAVRALLQSYLDCGSAPEHWRPDPADPSPVARRRVRPDRRHPTDRPTHLLTQPTLPHTRPGPAPTGETRICRQGGGLVQTRLELGGHLRGQLPRVQPGEPNPRTRPRRSPLPGAHDALEGGVGAGCAVRRPVLLPRLA